MRPLVSREPGRAVWAPRGRVPGAGGAVPRPASMGAGFWPTSRGKAGIAGSRGAGLETSGRALGKGMPGNQQPKFGAERTRIERDTRGES